MEDDLEGVEELGLGSWKGAMKEREERSDFEGAHIVRFEQDMA